jgi:hypothetical protein
MPQERKSKTGVFPEAKKFSRLSKKNGVYKREWFTASKD